MLGGGAQNHTVACRLHAERWRAREICFGDGIAGQRFRQTVVQDFYFSIRGELDVGGFQVAMDDTFVVRGFERLGDLPCEGQGFFDRERTALQPL